MNITPPLEIGNARVIAYLILDETHVMTGNTHHYISGSLFMNYYGLVICKYADDPGYYLFYCDNSWNEFTDTYHESIEDAIDQAEFEYANTRNEWIFVN